jgi:hypothetical protein
MAVYEVLFAANELFPDRPASERLAAAESVVVRLTKDGSVLLWRGRWIGPGFDRTPITDREVDQILRSWSTWSPEDGEAVVWMELPSE